ncbi:MAG TPA: hypothetical protein PK313_10805 [Myxococcota bacterium]|nr:hypothetical protein [Myxococcota bacterium]
MTRAIILAAASCAFLVPGCEGSGTGDTGDVLLEVFLPQGWDIVTDRPGLAEIENPEDAVREVERDDDAAADPGNSEDAMEDAGLPGSDVADDPGTASDPGAPDDLKLDPGAPDPGAADVVVPFSKTAGQYCELASECAGGAYCLGGEHTHAQCNPGCDVDADCATVAPNAKGQCTEVEGYSVKVCLWLCGMMGGTCPGDGQCDGVACR